MLQAASCSVFAARFGGMVILLSCCVLWMDTGPASSTRAGGWCPRHPSFPLAMLGQCLCLSLGTSQDATQCEAGTQAGRGLGQSD